MSNQVPWNKVILEEFIRLSTLSEEEEAVIRTRVAGWTRTRQSMELNMSMRKLDRIIAKLKIKYDQVEKFSPVLPPRKHSDAETYMDTH